MPRSCHFLFFEGIPIMIPQNAPYKILLYGEDVIEHVLLQPIK